MNTHRSPASFGEPFATNYAAELEKVNPLEAIFGDCDFAYIVAYQERRGSIAHDIFPGKVRASGVDTAWNDAHDTFADTEDRRNPNFHYRGCIKIERDGRWKPVQLFETE